MKTASKVSQSPQAVSIDDVPVPVRDARVFKAIYKEYKGLLMAVAAKASVPTGEREEMVQTAFLRLFETDALFLSEAAVRAFLVTTVKNLVIDRSRRSHTRCTEAVGSAVDRLDIELPVDGIEHERAVLAVNEMIDMISSLKGNAAFALFYRDGLSAKEIAARSGEAVGTVTAKLCRLRARFAAEIRTHVEAALSVR